MTPPQPPDGLPWPQRFWAVMTVTAGVGMVSLDTSIANAALPSIARDLQATPAGSIWVVNAYQLALVATLLPFGAVGEIMGYRRVYAAGMVVFTAASLLCALSWSLPTLAVARVLQGLGGSAMMSVNTALIRFIYPRARLGRGVGFNAMVVGVATALGPTVAAGLLLVSSWPLLFAVNIPFGLLGAALARRVLPETARSGHRFDWGAGALNAAAFGLLILGIDEAGHDAPQAVVLLLLAGAALAGTALVRRQRAHPAPMLPLDLYRRPVFALSSLTAMCSFAAQGLSFVSLPFLFQHDFGYSPVETGLLLTPWPVMTALMAPVAGPLSDRYPPAILGGAGLAVLCLGLVLMAALPGDAGPAGIAWRMVVCGLGFGFFQSPNLRAIMSSAPPERSGGASGTVATSRLLGQSTGAALVALCFTLSSAHGPALALALGAAFAGTACVASLSRLFTRPYAAPESVIGRTGE